MSKKLYRQIIYYLTTTQIAFIRESSSKLLKMKKLTLILVLVCLAMPNMAQDFYGEGDVDYGNSQNSDYGGSDAAEGGDYGNYGGSQNGDYGNGDDESGDYGNNQQSDGDYGGEDDFDGRKFSHCAIPSSTQIQIFCFANFFKILKK